MPIENKTSRAETPFEKAAKGCAFRTFQHRKCVHEKNAQRLKVGSCFEAACPIWDKKEQKLVNKAVEAPQAPGPGEGAGAGEGDKA